VDQKHLAAGAQLFRAAPAATFLEATMDAAGFDHKAPTTVQGNLAKLPRALAPLVARQQWCVWHWERSAKGVWQKVPFRATEPQRHASSADPDTWSDYATALATVQANRAEGITFMLTVADPLAAIDVDHCRDRHSGNLDYWAQLLVDQAAETYVEVTPSGSGIRFWGTATGEQLARNIRPLSVGKDAGIEFYRRPEHAKPLTISGLQLGPCSTLNNIDALVDRWLAWAEQHKGMNSSSTSASPGVSLKHCSVEEIERAVREGVPEDVDRSALFHAIVGHYRALGWSTDQIATHLGQYPDGVGGRYLAEGRLRREIGRCLDAWAKKKGQQFDPPNGWTNGWAPEAKAPPFVPEPAPELLDEEPPEAEPEDVPGPPLPPMYCHGDPDPRPLTSWLVKNLIASTSFGMLSGQWGSGARSAGGLLRWCRRSAAACSGRRSGGMRPHQHCSAPMRHRR
jgi:hypothetical protein